MKVSERQPVTDSDLADAAEKEMRLRLDEARKGFKRAFIEFQFLQLDPSVMQKLWFKFNATERRLMKDAEEGKEWSNG